MGETHFLFGLRHLTHPFSAPIPQPLPLQHHEMQLAGRRPGRGPWSRKVHQPQLPWHYRGLLMQTWSYHRHRLPLTCAIARPPDDVRALFKAPSAFDAPSVMVPRPADFGTRALTSATYYPDNFSYQYPCRHSWLLVEANLQAAVGKKPSSTLPKSQTY